MYEGIGDHLWAAARQNSERLALVAKGEERTYRQLFLEAASIAAMLSAAGIGAGDMVAVLSHRSVTAYTAILGALLAGCGYVPLNPAFPAERNKLILSGAEAAAIILDNESATGLAELGSLGGARIVLTPEHDAPVVAGYRQYRAPDLIRPDFETFSPVSIIDASRPAYLLFTSGTTGTPKGVPISHANLLSYLSAIHEIIPIKSHDRVLQAVDLTFDLSVHDMMLTWLNGAMLYSAPENGAILAPRLIEANRLTACLIVPSAAARSIEFGVLKPEGMPSLKYSLFAGEALPVSTVKLWQAAAPNATIFNLYGPTEGTIHTSWYAVSKDAIPETAVVPIGWPVGQQQMSLRDEDGREVEDGETGEIWLHGPQMTEGYWKAPHLDREKFIEAEGKRWYRTGDLGRFSPDHGIVFAGRVDRQVKVRGYRVELQDVEAALRSVTEREQVAVVAWPKTKEGNAEGLVAFLRGASMPADEIRRGCLARLPPYMVPDRVEFVESLPLNVNGKTDYAQLAGQLDTFQAAPAALS
jgi:amino acid adenylation domain-containing protein